ncbi:hypothetical protein BGZ80_001104 [Entomortierella chlamydospora]|uniref:CDT1 Geminin-binding domain-containing protein n=1 Tax=Entomortierella chlamydospora TaxID=101097 RepID=A0A9P6MR97_9FUNG|nr:hypothetical protein BGZ79_003781 [Entomortierella chlamydospora]KAG0010893.1 hypothetical protein BGZ80_001104 [Entomortierella chlamydospora]
MTAGNQTRLGFVQKKPGSKRPLHSKHNKAGSDTSTVADANVTTLPTPAEESLERTGTLAQSMEEKLAAYKKAKEEKAALKTSRVSETRLLRTRTSTRESTKETITQRTTTRNSVNKSQTLLEFKQRTVNESQDSTTITSKPDDVPAESSDNGVSVQGNGEEVTPVAESPKSNIEGNTIPDVEAPTVEPKIDNDSVKSAATSSQITSERETEKLVSEDIILRRVSDHSDDDESDIHPLARTVVKAAPRKSLGRIISEESSESNHRREEVYKSSSTLSKISRKPIIQGPIVKPLPLPSHMSVLLANFKALENVLTFTKRQGQLCFYHKIKRHVELQSSRNFEIKHLAQFKTILPEGYQFMAAPCIFEGTKTRSILIEMLELKDDVEGNFIPQEEKRRSLFTKRLYDHIKQHHQNFLSSTTPSRTDTYPHSWHPDFDLESVAPIEESEVPLLKPAVVDISNVNLKDLGSRKDLAQRTSGEKSSEAPSSDTKEKQHETAEEPANETPESSGVKVLSKLEQLKERIRQKQLEKKEAGQKVATPEEKRQALIASRLPAVFDLIRFKRVDVMPLKTLAEQVVKSSRMPISEDEGRESLEMLAKVLPEWCDVFSLGAAGRYFKVLRDDDKGTKIVHDEKALRARLVANSMSNV